MTGKTITIKVNGKTKQLTVNPNERLIDVLRYKLNIYSVKAGCLTGECGTCTVLYNGKPAKSCLILAAEADGAEIVTVEGITQEKEFDLIKDAFAKHNAFQCGFCTPAFTIITYWIAKNMPNATDEEIKEILTSILCRCTGYKQIMDAIKEALEAIKQH